MLIPDIVKEKLGKILGSQGFFTEAEDLRAYSYDNFARYYPDLVCLPASTQEVSAVLKIASEYAIPVYPRGTATSLTGAPLAVNGGISLGTSRLNKILEISPGDRLAKAQAGVITQDLQEAVSKEGLFYPPNPSSMNCSTIGGNVATNAGGAAGAKYGITRDFLLGLTVVLANGDIIKTGTRCQKDVAGFDLTRLFCGSEGLLGIICEVSVKLIPKPEAIQTSLAYFSNIENCANLVTEIVANKILPCTLEIMDGAFLEAVAQFYAIDFPKEIIKNGAALLIEVDGEAQTLDRQMSTITELCRKHQALKIEKASSEEERNKLWGARRGGTAALVKESGFVITLDYAVPVSKLAIVIQKLNSLAQEIGVKLVTIAHGADGNLHPMVIFDPTKPEELAKYHLFLEKSCPLVLALEGTISAEHGIGLEKQDLLVQQVGAQTLDICKQIKSFFDPQNILNPAKLV